MALYAIGDPHLSFGSNKPMDVFGPEWRNHPDKLKRGFEETVQPVDTVLLCGDLSWGMNLNQCEADFRFLNDLPGQTKLLLKGNHDYWWTTARKMEAFFQEKGLTTFRLLHNNCWLYGETAICGTRGWFYELEQAGHDEKMLRRECIRLEASLKAAGDREKLVFLHYPPVYQGYRCEPILSLLRQYGVRRCWYAHLHGASRRLAIEGTVGETAFSLISADHLNFIPKKILD
ncbi:MAG: metallophosphoesterase [Clostridiales bacterium]|nr:metallophosphoesterase [Clostridiales bacterium]